MGHSLPFGDSELFSLYRIEQVFEAAETDCSGSSCLLASNTIGVVKVFELGT